MFVITILIGGTIIYNEVEKWSYLDSLYFSVTTLTTVGLGDLAPKTDAGKMFTVLYIFTGVGIILGFMNSMAHHANNQNPMRKYFNNKLGETGNYE